MKVFKSTLKKSVSVPMTDYSYQFIKEQSEKLEMTMPEYLKILIMEEHNRQLENKQFA